MSKNIQYYISSVYFLGHYYCYFSDLYSILAFTQRSIWHWCFALVLHRFKFPSKGDISRLHLCRQFLIFYFLLHLMRHPELVL